MQNENSPLTGLDVIDWANLGHAYGSASDVPTLLHAVASGSDEARRQALWQLWGNIHHQGTVYSASAPAVPFLARLAGTASIPDVDRAQLVALIAAISSGRSYLDVHEPLIGGGHSHEEPQQMAEELGWVRAAHEAAAAVAPTLLARIDEASPAIAWSLVILAAQIPEAAAEVKPTLREMADSATNPLRRKAVELTLALIDGTVTAADLRSVLDVRDDLVELADPGTWRTPTEGAQQIVTFLLEEAD